MRLDYLALHGSSGRLLVKVMRSPNILYKISLKIGKLTCLHSKIEEETWKWHARLGHIKLKTIKKMSTHEMVHGLPNIELEKELCETCMVGKQAHKVFQKATQFRVSHALELLHGDLYGPISPATPERNKYIFVILDDYTTYMWTVLLKEEGEAFEIFKWFKAHVEKELRKMILNL